MRRGPPSGGARAESAAAPPVTTSPTTTMVGPPNRSARRPDTGERANIPRVWAEMTNPTAARSWPCSVMWSGVIVMMSTIVAWRATRATRAIQTLGRRRSDPDRVPGLVALHGARRRVGELVGVRAQEDERQDRGGGHEEGRHQVGPREPGQADRLGDGPRPRHEVRPDDRADGGAPHHEPQGRRAPLRLHEVGGRVAGEVVRRVAEADEHGRGEEERERADDEGEDRQQGSRHADRVAGDEAGPAPVGPGHDGGQDRSAGGGAEDHGRTGDPCPGRACRRAPGRRSWPR